jgi:hypothetical protein
VSTQVSDPLSQKGTEDLFARPLLCRLLLNSTPKTHLQHFNGKLCVVYWLCFFSLKAATESSSPSPNIISQYPPVPPTKPLLHASITVQVYNLSPNIDLVPAHSLGLVFCHCGSITDDSLVYRRIHQHIYKPTTTYQHGKSAFRFGSKARDKAKKPPWCVPMSQFCINLPCIGCHNCKRRKIKVIAPSFFVLTCV